MRRWRSGAADWRSSDLSLPTSSRPWSIQACAGSPVAPGAAGLLVVGLERARRVEVGDEAHVRLVDAHAEGDGRHHDHAFLLEEVLLVRRAERGVQAGVVGQGAHALGVQRARHRVDLAARGAVDDAALAGLGAQEARQLGLGLELRQDAVEDVRPVEAGDEDPAAAEVQTLDDLAAGRRVGGGGERQARDLGEALVKDLQLEIVGPEVVPPLRDAVRLVDREEGDPALGQQVEEAGQADALRRRVDEVERALLHGALDRGLLREAHRGVERRGPHAELGQRRHLVLHQRDQRRDDDREAVQAQGRHLVAERLAAAGRHDDQRVLAAEDVVDHLGLEPAEGRVAPDRAQHVERVAPRGDLRHGVQGGATPGAADETFALRWARSGRAATLP